MTTLICKNSVVYSDTRITVKRNGKFVRHYDECKADVANFPVFLTDKVYNVVKVVSAGNVNDINRAIKRLECGYSSEFHSNSNFVLYCITECDKVIKIDQRNKPKLIKYGWAGSGPARNPVTIAATFISPKLAMVCSSMVDKGTGGMIECHSANDCKVVGTCKDGLLCLPALLLNLFGNAAVVTALLPFMPLALLVMVKKIMKTVKGILK